LRKLALARTHTACTSLHVPSQRSPAPIPDMRRPPRARIALNREPLLPKQLQDVEARRMKKRWHVRGLGHHLLPAHEGDGRHQKRRPDAKRDSDGQVGRLWCSPVHCEEASQVVSWQLEKSLPCYHRSSQPPLRLQLQARGSSADARHFRRARSARASRRSRRHVARLVSQRSAALCKCLG
jgi:hypothetical protein